MDKIPVLGSRRQKSRSTFWVFLLRTEWSTNHLSNCLLVSFVQRCLQRLTALRIKHLLYKSYETATQLDVHALGGLGILPIACRRPLRSPRGVATSLGTTRGCFRGQRPKASGYEDRVGRSWVRIPEPARIFLNEISVKYYSVHFFTVFHSYNVRDYYDVTVRLYFVWQIVHWCE